MNTEIEELKEKLLDSHWPKCNALAEEIASHNNEGAKNALIEALTKAKRHHARTAAIKALVKFNDDSIVEHIKPLLDDPAYETRMEAKEALRMLTGKDYTTSKGE